MLSDLFSIHAPGKTALMIVTSLGAIGLILTIITIISYIVMISITDYTTIIHPHAQVCACDFHKLWTKHYVLKLNIRDKVTAMQGQRTTT